MRIFHSSFSVVNFQQETFFIRRYIPTAKPADNPSNANARQNQIVAQQVHILKTTINHLKNAYNGNDIEWSDSGNKIEIESFISIADELLLSTEEGEDNYESGSGSGSGVYGDDEDEAGSGKLWITFINKLNFQRFSYPGIGSYPQEIQPAIVPPHNPIDTSVPRHDVPEIGGNDIDIEHNPNTSGDSDINEQSRETKTSAGSSPSSQEWRTKRLIFTYFMPLVLAWFGGSISGAVADLL